LTVRFGAHCYLFTDRWSDDQLGLLDRAVALGLDHWEIAVGDDVEFTPSLTRARAEALGLTLTVSPGGVWPMACDLSADDAEDRERGLAWHQGQVALAAELGATAYTGALYGHPGTAKRRIPPRGELGWTADGLHALAQYAADRDVAIVLEPMSHFRTHLVNTSAQLITVLEMADHRNLWGLLDTFHLVTEERDYGAAIRAMGARLWGLHACESDRGVPGDGLVPWTSVFAALVQIDFNGYLVMETYNSSVGDPPGNFAYERGMFHNPCPDGAAFVRAGLQFLKLGLQTARQGRTII
jgi:D-psicose/D-tagatose/L-ribulose 3-epimerase